MILRPLLPAFCLLVSVLGLASSASAVATESPRERLLFTTGWRFQKDDPAGTDNALSYEKLKPWLLPVAGPFVASPASRPAGDAPGGAIAYIQPAFDDSSWRQLDLPHDWGAEGPFDQALPGETGKLPWHGIAWYRKTFDLPAADRDRRIVLEIDGAMSYSAVWCNGRLVGGWPYGYASYQVDLTPYLKPGARNTLALRLDNPKESSRWYPGGGIYRNVWLTKTSPVHVAQWGTHVTTPEVSAASATVAISADIANASSASVKTRVATQIFKADSAGLPSGPVLASSAPAELTLAAGETKTVSASLALLKPVLWDLATAERYTAVTLVQQDGKLVDRHETVFGIRTIQFTVDNGFLHSVACIMAAQSYWQGKRLYYDSRSEVITDTAAAASSPA